MDVYPRYSTVGHILYGFFDIVLHLFGHVEDFSFPCDLDGYVEADFPFPPLDGSKVLAMFLPDRWYGRWMQLERYGMIVLMAALWFGLLDGFLMAARNLVLNAMLNGANFAYLGMLSLLTR